MTKKLTQTIIDQAVECYNNGQATVTDIRIEWGRRYTDVRHILLSNGALIKGQTRLADDVRTVLSNRYVNEPVSIKDLATEFRCAESTITNYLKEKLGEELFNRVKANKQPWANKGMTSRTESILADFDAGMEVPELAEKYIRTENHVAALIRNHGRSARRRKCLWCGGPLPSGWYCSQACMDAAAQDRFLQKEYGISLEDRRAIYESQGGCCAICGYAFEFHQLVVDHDHDSGEVRGLLCSPCNAGIGLLKDSVDVLQKAVRYMKR